MPASQQVEKRADAKCVVAQPIELVTHNLPKDLVYIELLQHWLSHTYRTCAGPRRVADVFGAIIFNHALNHTFLMRSILAISALHKATLADDHDRWKYLTLSESMQAEGLNHINTIIPDRNTETIVPVFLFAFVTGIHRLCQTLTQNREPDRLLDALLDSMAFLRGVNTIIAGWWGYIKSSELSAVINVPESKQETQKTYDLEPLDRIQELVEGSITNAEVLNAYKTVIDGLRKACEDTYDPDTPDIDASVGPVVVWMITMPQAFADGLRHGHPEALITLAYTAPLFHRRRTCWGVGEAGRLIVQAIRSRLEEKWQVWLKWPQSIVDGG